MFNVLLWLLLDLVVVQLEHHLLGPQQESELLHLLLVQSRGEAGDIREGLGRRARHVRMQKKLTAEYQDLVYEVYEMKFQ